MKKELRWFGLFFLVVVLVEYVILIELTLAPIVQFIIQMIIGLFLISALIRLSYKIWVVYEHEQSMQDEDDFSSGDRFKF